MKQILKQTLLQVIQEKKKLYLNKEMTINSKFLANAIFGLSNPENCKYQILTVVIKNKQCLGVNFYLILTNQRRENSPYAILYCILINISIKYFYFFTRFPYTAETYK
jgi:hypothetical protein